MNILKNKSIPLFVGVGLLVFLLFYIVVNYNVEEGFNEDAAEDLDILQNDMINVETAGDPHENWKLINDDVSNLIYNLENDDEDPYITRTIPNTTSPTPKVTSTRTLPPNYRRN